MRKIVLIILTALLLLATVAFVIWKWYIQPEVQPIPEAIGAEELAEYTVETEDMTTNLKSGGFVQIKFQIQGDSVEAKEELEHRMFQIRHIMVKTLASKQAEELKGEEGITKLEKNIQDQMNQIMVEGHVLKVFTTKKLLQ